MIHICTIHFKTPKWVELQAKFFSKYISQEYKVYSYCDGFDFTEYKKYFYFVSNSPVNLFQDEGFENPSVGYLDHISKLNSLTNEVVNIKSVDPYDIIIWMDSDSLLVSNLSNYIYKKMKQFPLLAVCRPENNGDIIPHPSFTCTTVGFWKNNHLDWSGVPGKCENQTNKSGLHDPGGKMYKTLEKHEIDWYRMRRSFSFTEHKVFYTIYDDVVYHHGAGSQNRRGCRAGISQNLTNEETQSSVLSKLNNKY